MSMDRGTLTRLSMQRLSKRFSLRNRDYDRVDDTSDSRVPLHNEEMFQHGIKFKAKYIGSLEIARPSSKLDIITAMRRIRYEYKVKGLKKKRCIIDVSTNGVKITRRKRRRMRKQLTEAQMFIMEHQIHRVFYVSHDSQDLKIFSYITREAPSNVFRCNVFKAYKKRMALHVVRTLGQAFDVCHKLNPRPKKKKQTQEENETTKTEAETRKEEEAAMETSQVDDLDKEFQELALKSTTSDLLNQSTISDPFAPGGAKMGNGTTTFDPLDLPLPPPGLESIDGATSVPASHMAYIGRPRPRPNQTTIEENKFTASLDHPMSPSASIGEPLTMATETNQWSTEKQQLTVQLTLLQEQLQAETASRIESQARVEHLLLQNKELLSHLQKLMWQLQQLQSLQLPAATSPQSQPPPPSQEPANSSAISSPSPPAPIEPAPSEPSTSADKQTLELAFTPQTAPVSSSPLSLPANDVDKETLDAAFTPQQPKIISLASPLSLPGDDVSDQPAANTAFIPQQPTVPEEPRPSTPNPLTDEMLLPLSSTPTQDTTVDKQLLDAAFTPN